MSDVERDDIKDTQDNLDTNQDDTQKEPETLIDEQTEGIDEMVRIEPKILEEEMQSSYLKYAMSVIASRALPDVRDGMKPVHRRIIYVMNRMGLTPGGKYRKSAQVVGEVLGKYHPHGDTAVYNALVRLAQDFSMRYTLVDGQGNFGSLDGDSPAAMRYTECKMTKLATSLVSDIEKDTVDFVDNYDGSHQEPRVLPTRIPQLIINGTTGIAVGMATSIPPHNLGEVNEALIHLLDNKDATIEEIMEFIKGPDLPTSGIIYGKQDILKAYSTGRGKCAVRARAELTENSIIITDIPYMINKADLVKKIADLVKDKKVTEIRDLRDESNKEGIRIVIETKREASPEIVLNQLYKHTDLQTNVHFNLLALVDQGRQPKLLNLKEILMAFVDHRYEVVTRRTQFDLKKAEDELHILDGLKIALDFIDEVIALIRASYDKEEASKKLQERFKLSERQAEAILQMRLQTLTNLDKSKIEQEREAKIKLIAELKNILENPEVMKQLIKDEINDISEKYKSPRKTQIVEFALGDYNKEDVIEEEDVLIQLTNSQYIKVLPLTTFRTQSRGGRGVTSFNPKDEDWVKSSMIANTHDYLYAFTNKGRAFKIRVFDLPGGSRQGRGQALINYFQLQKEEIVTNILTLTKEQEENKEGSLIFATKTGKVKRTKLDLFKNIRKSGIIATGLKDDDEVVSVLLSLHKEDNIIMSSDNGKTCIFDREALSPLGRTAQGVKGIKLKKGDECISLQLSSLQLQDNSDDQDTIIESDSDSQERQYPSLLVITENGYGKQTYLGDYRKTNRAAGGVKTLNMTKKTGQPVLVQVLYGNEENLIITTKNGITIRMTLETISQLGRNTQGVRVIKLDKGDSVVSGSVL
jgi:DNA gyrase subunit A